MRTANVFFLFLIITFQDTRSDMWVWTTELINIGIPNMVTQIIRDKDSLNGFTKTLWACYSYVYNSLLKAISFGPEFNI